MAGSSIEREVCGWLRGRLGGRLRRPVRLARMAAVLVVAIVLVPSLVLCAPEDERLSRFGEYKGYSAAVYDSSVRTSRYVTMRDGIRLAVDVIRPAKEGKVEEKPLPALWTHTRYRRAFVMNGAVSDMTSWPQVRPLLEHGYVVVAVDVRGSGASFGSWKGAFTPEETQDAHEITEWIAAQPWCDGNVGMFGASYLGITQLMAASKKPPHLKAIFPMVALFDVYTLAYPGGIFYDNLIKTWSTLTRTLDTEMPAAPVDGEDGGRLLEEALAEHEKNRPLIEIFGPLHFRDSRDGDGGDQPYLDWNPAGHLDAINESGIPIYLWCGWFDSFTKDGFLMHRAFTAPRKIVMGAWSHSPRDPEILAMNFEPLAVEHLRWFDYWLKGIDNGIMDEPPITYQVMKGTKDFEWRTAEEWPLPGENRVEYFLNVGPTGSVDSVNDGLLSTARPGEDTAGDVYTVDYGTSTGMTTRWANAVGEPYGYPNMALNDQKALTYTTEPLAEDLEVTGHIIVTLWVSSTANDADFFVYLEEVDTQGWCSYVTEGCLRASHRAIHPPLYDNLELPFHRSFAGDVVPLAPGEPAALVFDLQPTSNVFDAGHRMRIAITCSDEHNADTPELAPPPTVTVYRGGVRSSHVSVPVIPPDPGGR